MDLRSIMSMDAAHERSVVDFDDKCYRDFFFLMISSGKNYKKVLLPLESPSISNCRHEMARMVSRKQSEEPQVILISPGAVSSSKFSGVQ